MPFGVVVPKAVQQTVNRKQPQFIRRLARRLGNGALHRNGDVAHPPDTLLGFAREGEHVGGRLIAEKPAVQIAKLGVIGQPHGQARPSVHAQLVSATAQQRPDGGPRDDPALFRRQRWVADEGHPQRLLTPT